MNEPKTHCATCGTSIQKRTADKYYGLCAPCHRKAVVNPPDTFEMPQDLVQRLVSMGQDPESYRQDVWRDGPASVHEFLDRILEAAAECRRWAPVLRAYAAECRQAYPAPRLESLSSLERAQDRLLYTRMREFAESKDGIVTLAPRPHHLAVISTNRVGVAAAEEVFGGSGAVILEEAELAYWFSEVYEHRDDAFGWCSFASWSIEDGVGDAVKEFRRVQPLSDGVYWVLNWGVQWGPLAGGGSSELWLWDGERATLIEAYQIQS